MYASTCSSEFECCREGCWREMWVLLRGKVELASLSSSVSCESCESCCSVSSVGMLMIGRPHTACTCAEREEINVCQVHHNHNQCVNTLRVMLCIRELTNLAYASCYVLHYSLYIHFGIQVCLILRPHSPPPLVPGNEATYLCFRSCVCIPDSSLFVMGRRTITDI